MTSTSEGADALFEVPAAPAPPESPAPPPPAEPPAEPPAAPPVEAEVAQGAPGPVSAVSVPLPLVAVVCVDHQPGAGEVAVWITSRGSETGVGHTNAVVRPLPPDGEQGWVELVRTMAGPQPVVYTAGSEPLPGVPGYPVEVFDELAERTVQAQRELLDGIAACEATPRYSPTTGKRITSRLVRPELTPPPDGPDGWPDTAVQRTLATANRVAGVWGCWLATDSERARRAYLPGPRRTLPWPEGFVLAGVGVE